LASSSSCSIGFGFFRFNRRVQRVQRWSLGLVLDPWQRTPSKVLNVYLLGKRIFEKFSHVV
jgi:hypothetical protein